MSENKDTSVVKREYVFSTYVKNKFDSNRDALIVKEILHKEGHPSKRRLTVYEDYKRPFWITKKQYRVHNDKKEFEEVEKLDKFWCTQRELPTQIFSKLNGMRPFREPQLREVCTSPYVYGADITSNDLLKQDYVNKFGKMFTKSTVAIMDYEWSMTDPKEPIIAGIVSMGEHVHIAMTKEWLGDLSDRAVEHVKKMCYYHHGDLIKERNIKLKVTVHSTPGKLVTALLGTVHSLKPDFLAFWNMEGDVEHMLTALKNDDIDPALVFSDPSIPDEYKSFQWNRDEPFKIKSNGERMSKAPSERWHTIYTPASFYCICAMSSFRTIRAREQQRNSYGLDAILHEFLNIGKMKFNSVPPEITGRNWHVVMQTKYKMEYMAYLFGDGVFVEQLNEKTKDLSETVRPQADTSSFDRFKSNPRRLVTDLHIEVEPTGLIVGTTAKNMVTKLDALIPSTKEWIVTLPAELEEGLGLCIVAEYPNMPTNFTFYASDIDLTGAYPSGGEIANVSKGTNVFILTKNQKGFTQNQTREWGINLTSVQSNPISLGVTCYGFTDMDVMYDEFKKDMGLV